MGTKSKLEQQLDDLVDEAPVVKPGDLKRRTWRNHRRNYYNREEGDTELKVDFSDTGVQIFAEAWYDGSECTDGTHGWRWPSKTNHGEEDEEPHRRSDCGNADLRESQVEELHAALGQWLELRRKQRREAARLKLRRPGGP